MSGESRAVRGHGWDGGRRAVGPGRRLGIAAAVARRIVATLRVWAERAHQRRQLSALDDRLLRDIGLNRWDVDREIRKPFWRP